MSRMTRPARKRSAPHLIQSKDRPPFQLYCAMPGNRRKSKDPTDAVKSAASPEQQSRGTQDFHDKRATTEAQRALQRKIQKSRVEPSEKTAQLQALIHQPPTPP